MASPENAIARDEDQENAEARRKLDEAFSMENSQERSQQRPPEVPTEYRVSEPVKPAKPPLEVEHIRAGVPPINESRIFEGKAKPMVEKPNQESAAVPEVPQDGYGKSKDAWEKHWAHGEANGVNISPEQKEKKLAELRDMFEVPENPTPEITQRDPELQAQLEDITRSVASGGVPEKSPIPPVSSGGQESGKVPLRMKMPAIVRQIFENEDSGVKPGVVAEAIGKKAGPFVREAASDWKTMLTEPFKKEGQVYTPEVKPQEVVVTQVEKPSVDQKKVEVAAEWMNLGKASVETNPGKLGRTPEIPRAVALEKNSVALEGKSELPLKTKEQALEDIMTPDALRRRESELAADYQIATGKSFKQERNAKVLDYAKNHKPRLFAHSLREAEPRIYEKELQKVEQEESMMAQNAILEKASGELKGKISRADGTLDQGALDAFLVEQRNKLGITETAFNRLVLNGYHPEKVKVETWMGAWEGVHVTLPIYDNKGNVVGNTNIGTKADFIKWAEDLGKDENGWDKQARYHTDKIIIKGRERMILARQEAKKKLLEEVISESQKGGAPQTTQAEVVPSPENKTLETEKGPEEVATLNMETLGIEMTERVKELLPVYSENATREKYFDVVEGSRSDRKSVYEDSKKDLVLAKLAARRKGPNTVEGRTLVRLINAFTEQLNYMERFKPGSGPSPASESVYDPSEDARIKKEIAGRYALLEQQAEAKAA
jgi:hypothetical protein